MRNIKDIAVDIEESQIEFEPIKIEEPKFVAAVVNEKCGNEPVRIKAKTDYTVRNKFLNIYTIILFVSLAT